MLGLAEHVRERRDVIVPLDQRGDRPEPAHGLPVEAPDTLGDGRIVGIEQVGTVIAVAGEMDLPDALGGQPGEVVAGAEAVVRGAHEDVVHVEEDATVGAGGDRAEERPLGHRRVGEGDVARDVLQQDATAERVLDLADAIDDVRQGLVGVRQWQEIVRVPAAVTTPAEMVRHPRRLDPLAQAPELTEIAGVQRIARPDRQRHAVQHDRRVGADPFQDRQGTAPANHVVLADDLEPVGTGALENLGIVLGSQPDAVTEVPAVREHDRRIGGPGRSAAITEGAWPGLAPLQLTTLPPFFSHSAFGTDMTPLPLHEFCPAQLLPAPAQPPLPLHSLMPTHFTLSPPALSSARALTAPVANSVAAAVAIRMPLLARVIETLLLSRMAGVLFRVAGLDATVGGSFHPAAVRLHHPGLGG